MSSCWCVKPFHFHATVSSSLQSHVRGTTASTALSLQPRSPHDNNNKNNKKLLFQFQPKQHKRASTTVRCSSALTPELKSTLDKVVTSNKVVLFMKGNKDFPQCGFSNTVVQILKSLNVPFETINILENEILRQGLKEYSSWPTFPQLYIDGEFFGGCDITVEAYQKGELQELLEKAMLS